MKLRFTFLLTVVLAFWTSATQAGPGDGLGLFLDFGQLKPVNDESGREYQGSKVIGDQIDYQFALGDSFSFSLFSLYQPRDHPDFPSRPSPQPLPPDHLSPV